jgi:hypothetical protein
MTKSEEKNLKEARIMNDENAVAFRFCLCHSSAAMPSDF